MASLNLDDAAEYLSLIELSILEVQARIKADIIPEEHDLLLTNLAAAICCYKYIVAISLSEPMSVKGLNVTLQTDSRSKINHAKLIKNEAVISAKQLLKDDDFFFGRMI